MRNFLNINNILIKDTDNLKNVLNIFNQHAVKTDGGFCIVINNKKKMLGVLTDGDVRRLMIKGIGIESQIKNYINKNFTYVFENQSKHEVLRLFDSGVKCIPVLNKDKEPVDFFTLSNFSAETRYETKTYRARVPVRISFCGGGSDKSFFMNENDGVVISSTINKYNYVSLVKRGDSKIKIHSRNFNESYSCDHIDNIEFGDKLDLIKEAIKIMQPKFGFEMEVFSEIDTGTGLGGSSSMCVAVIGVLNRFNNEKNLDLYGIAEVAYQVERLNQKITGGWQDQYSTLFGGFNWIEFRNKDVLVNPIKLNRRTLLELEYNLMLFRVGGKHFSGEIEASKNKEYKENKIQVNQKNKDLVRVAKSMKEAILKNKLSLFGKLLNESWQIKRKFRNVSNKEIDEIYKIAMDNGASGGKLLGSGQSGYMIFYCENECQEKVKEELTKKRVKFEKLSFTEEGLEIWETKK